MNPRQELGRQTCRVAEHIATHGPQTMAALSSAFGLKTRTGTWQALKRLGDHGYVEAGRGGRVKGFGPEPLFYSLTDAGRELVKELREGK